MSSVPLMLSEYEIWKTFPFLGEKDYKPLTFDKVVKIARWCFDYRRELGYEQFFIEDPGLVDLAFGNIHKEFQDDWNRTVSPTMIQRIQSLFPPCCPKKI